MKYLLMFTAISSLLAGSSVALAQVPPPPPPFLLPPPPPRPEYTPEEAEYSSEYDPRHYDWCADRYSSYRASDNTFRAAGGRRRQCHSPFD